MSKGPFCDGGTAGTQKPGVRRRSNVASAPVAGSRASEGAPGYGEALLRVV